MATPVSTCLPAAEKLTRKADATVVTVFMLLSGSGQSHTLGLCQRGKPGLVNFGSAFENLQP